MHGSSTGPVRVFQFSFDQPAAQANAQQGLVVI